MSAAPEAPPFSGPPTLASLWSDVSGRDLADWDLSWPADVFALVGSVLQRSTAYRFGVSPPAGRQWPPGGARTWDALVCAAGQEWCTWAERPDGPPPALVGDSWAVLRDRGSVHLDDVADGSAWDVVEALFTLLAASDEACAGIGGVSGPVHAGGERFRARSAELLARTGSLSRISCYRLRVLPKVRTPPGGISFRSLSRYLCLRGSSVGVAWQKVPAGAVGTTPRRYNVLLLPWPLQVRQRDFQPVPGSVRRTEDEPFGMFEFAPAGPFEPESVDRVLRAALDEVDRVDAVVLPEVAVPAADVGRLEAVLGEHGVSLLVTGVREAVRAENGLSVNRVHLGVRLGGAWAHFRQNKHHRWFLDASQIEQYHIAGALHPSVRWWEAMEVPRRSVQVLEIGAGLTIVAVVCEDLARLDEVADLVRDVGPSLVVTLLLDGPQLGSRWTARYASVLADDPGSAVLTLTAAGMVARSRPPGRPPSAAVALWKDPVQGLREIDLEPGASGALVTVALGRSRRRAADGRMPLDNTSGLVLAGVQGVVARPPSAASGTPPRTAEVVDLPAEELTVLTAWAAAAAEALHRDPAGAPAVVADAPRGAAWRRALHVDEPSVALDRGLEALAEDVRVLAGRWADGAHAALAGLPPPGGPAEEVARTVLVTTLRTGR